MSKISTSLSSLIVIVTVTNCVICPSHVEAIKNLQPSTEVGGGSLQEDVCDFLNIIPIDDVRNLTKHFYANDQAMREAYDYLRSGAYQKMVESLSQVSILKNCTKMLNDSGINFAELEKKIEKIVLTNEETDSIAFVGASRDAVVNGVNEGEIAGGEVKSVVEVARNHEKSKIMGTTTTKKEGLGGINAFFTEVLLLIPQDEVLTLFFAKLEQSKAFSSFLKQMATTYSEDLYENLEQNSRVQMIYFDLRSHGIDILEWGKSLKGFVGY